MKSLNIFEIFESFAARFKLFLRDPILSDAETASSQVVLNPSNFEIINAIIFAMAWAFLVGIILQMPRLLTMDHRLSFILDFISKLMIICSVLMPVVLAFAMLLGYLFTKILGGDRSLRHYVGVCILELPVSIVGSAITNFGYSVSIALGIPTLALLFSTIQSLAVYRNLVLNGVRKKMACAATIVLFVLCYALIALQGYRPMPTNLGPSFNNTFQNFEIPNDYEY